MPAVLRTRLGVRAGGTLNEWKGVRVSDLRFVQDDYGVGMEVEGLAGLHRVYFARKPKDGFSLRGEDNPQGLDAANEVLRVGAVDQPGREPEDRGIGRELPGEQSLDLPLERSHGADGPRRSRGTSR
jgi:hypothetical protein